MIAAYESRSGNRGEETGGNLLGEHKGERAKAPRKGMDF